MQNDNFANISELDKDNWMDNILPIKNSYQSTSVVFHNKIMPSQL